MQKSTLLDSLGIWLSSLCIVHCGLTLIALLSLPSMIAAQNDKFHFAMALILPVVGALSFAPGYWMHRNKTVLMAAFAGLALIGFAAMNPLHNMNVYSEVMVTTLGGCILIAAHSKNRGLSSSLNRGSARTPRLTKPA